MQNPREAQRFPGVFVWGGQGIMEGDWENQSFVWARRMIQAESQFAAGNRTGEQGFTGSPAAFGTHHFTYTISLYFAPEKMICFLLTSRIRDDNMFKVES
ncbi:hypothetical protein AV656_12430 [Bhargavaea cecembensis]|uniref:Uncharacterized protein n=1 Tax=Bhargavaea cecembensis TaxID=394098 RepID=A0A161SQ63_9BACL|nr:hypothetical protein AV656_12430 [Bhargavaea cecembensis]